MEAVFTRTSERIITVVREAALHYSGVDRVRVVVRTGLREVRRDQVIRSYLQSPNALAQAGAVMESAAVLRIAGELIGAHSTSPETAWMVRGVLSLLYWPPSDPSQEEELLEQLVAVGVRRRT